MEKKDRLYSVICEVTSVISELPTSEIIKSLDEYKDISGKIIASAQALSALVHIAELMAKEK